MEKHNQFTLQDSVKVLAMVLRNAREYDKGNIDIGQLGTATMHAADEAEKYGITPELCERLSKAFDSDQSLNSWEA